MSIPLLLLGSCSCLVACLGRMEVVLEERLEGLAAFLEEGLETLMVEV